MARLIALAFIFFLSSLLACSGEPSKELPAAPQEGIDSLRAADPRRALPADPELEEFLWRAQFLLRRLSMRRPTREETGRALRAGPAGFARLAQLSPVELSARMDTLRWQGAVLVRRYPELAACLEEIEREEGPPCDPSDALALVEDLVALEPPRKGATGIGADDLPYLASLILSAATGNPVLYFIGSAWATRMWSGR